MRLPRFITLVAGIVLVDQFTKMLAGDQLSPALATGMPAGTPCSCGPS